MSDRIVRDELLTSERYWSVSAEARNLFLALILSADDTGRYTAARFALRTKCMAGTVSPERLEKLLLELVDVDLIRLYNDGQNLFIPRFRQRLRYPHSRYPDTPKEWNEIKNIPEKKTDSSQTRDRPESAEVKRSEELPSPPPPEVDPGKPLRAATWDAYRTAFAARWKVDLNPVRNASLNSKIASLVKKLGGNAPAVATFYLQHNDNYYVKKRHPVGLLLQDAEGLYQQFKTGIKATSLEARSAEQEDSLREQVKRVTAKMNARKGKS